MVGVAGCCPLVGSPVTVCNPPETLHPGLRHRTIDSEAMASPNGRRVAGAQGRETTLAPARLLSLPQRGGPRGEAYQSGGSELDSSQERWSAFGVKHLQRESSGHSCKFPSYIK